MRSDQAIRNTYANASFGKVSRTMEADINSDGRGGSAVNASCYKKLAIDTRKTLVVLWLVAMRHCFKNFIVASLAAN